MTGRYPHRNGATYFRPIDAGIPTLSACLRERGYVTGIFGKVRHLRPAESFVWDRTVASGQLVRGRSPARFYAETVSFLRAAKQKGAPFFLLANSHDPHRPFAGSEGLARRRYPRAPRKFGRGEIEVPGFLPDLPGVRVELAQYFASVSRFDQTVGEILRALEEEGFADNTVVLLMSDHGMSFPFAKANCYLASTKVPFLVRWPGVVAPGSVDTNDYVSGIDVMPTLLQVAGAAPVEGVDGRSFVPLLRGETQAGRDTVFTMYYKSSGGRQQFPMRCVHHDGFGYIYNPWSDGETVMETESMSGMTFTAMEKAAKSDPDIAERIDQYLYRTPDELYDFDHDPNALVNLVQSEDYAGRLADLQRRLLEFMRETEDPLLGQFEAHLGQ